MTTTITTIAEYLAFKDQASITLGVGAPEDWAARSYEGLVLKEGRAFERKPLPVSYRKMRIGHCYNNAMHCVLRDGHTQYRYVEGYASGFLACEHAWVLDTADGKIFDPTWDNDDEHQSYYGIVFPTQYVWDHMLATGYYGILANDWEFGNPVLRNGRSLWERYLDGSES